MKSIFKHTKAALIALLAMLMSITMVFGLAACNKTPNGDDNTDPVITKYDATFDASVVMGPAGSISFGDVLSGTYITKENGNYTLTLIFKLGEIEVYGAKGQIFIDDNPANPETVDGLKDGTIGYYKSNGELVTDGVTLTYSSGDNYGQTPEKKNVYYVQSAAFSVDSLRDTYELTLFVNSMMKGMQLSKDTYKAAVKLDLSSGKTVSGITGLGVATKGEAPQPDVKYSVTINGFTSKEGTATLDPQQSSYEPGTQVTLTVTPSSGYSVRDVSVNGEKIELDENGAYVFEINENTEINISFQIDFELPVKLWNATSDQASMAASAFEDNARITVNNGKITLYVYTKEMSVMGITAHLQEMQAKQADGSYEDAVVVSKDEEGNPNCFSVTISHLEEYIAVKVNPHIEMMGNTFLDARLKLDLTNVADFVWEELGETPPSKVREYQVPIASLTSSAPLKPVQEAFAKAFGEYVTLIVDDDGSMRLRIKNEHMKIDMSSVIPTWGTYDANVAWVQGATVISAKEDVYSDVSGQNMTDPTLEKITVPDVFEIAYSPDCNGVIELTVGIDFMAKMNGKEIEDYSTKITLTLDLSSLNLDELN